MGRKRVEDKHPEFVGVVLAGAAGAGEVYGVTEGTVRTVLRRFFAEDVERERDQLAAQVADLQQQVAQLGARLAPLDPLGGGQLYGVQEVHDAPHAAALLDSGAALGTLAGVLVAVRPVHVHAGGGAVVSMATVSAHGMAVATVCGLQDAGLPVPVLA